MQHSFDVMQAALRILRAITEKPEPSAEDVKELTRIYSEKPDHMGLDVWACEAIESALKHRAKVRAENDSSATQGAGG